MDADNANVRQTENADLMWSLANEAGERLDAQCTLLDSGKENIGLLSPVHRGA